MGKTLLLHLLALVAGWGIVAALRTAVPADPAGETTAAESRAPTKTARTCPPAEVAAGQKILQRLRAQLPPPADDLNADPPRFFAETLTVNLREDGYDPAAPAPPRHFVPGAGNSHAFAPHYHRNLHEALATALRGAHGPDLLHAFRYGRRDAVELYNSLAAAMPSAAANDALRLALYDQLVPLDPARAAALLQTFSADAAAGIKYQALKENWPPYAPDTTYALLATIPPPADAAAMIPRQSAWLTVTPDYLQTYGSDYLHWVEQLPAGTDRDLAAVALMVRLRENDLPGYRRMRAVVTDPRMLNGFPHR